MLKLTLSSALALVTLSSSALAAPGKLDCYRLTLAEHRAHVAVSDARKKVAFVNQLLAKKTVELKADLVSDTVAKVTLLGATAAKSSDDESLELDLGKLTTDKTISRHWPKDWKRTYWEFDRHIKPMAKRFDLNVSADLNDVGYHKAVLTVYEMPGYKDFDRAELICRAAKN